MRILITGATGTIGSYITPYLAKNHQVIATARKTEQLEAYKDLDNVEAHHLDVSNMEQCQEVIRDADVVLHLAVAPVGSSWENTLDANLIGMYNVIESARENGIKRFIFTSSIHAVDGYPSDMQIEVDDLPRPPDLYGVSKVYGEALCSYYAHEKDMEIIAIRVGAFDGLQPNDGKVDVDPRILSIFFHPDDFGRMIDYCLTLEMDEPYYILNGVSDNSFKRLSMVQTKKILGGYEPSFDAFRATHVTIEKTLSPDEVDAEEANIK